MEHKLLAKILQSAVIKTLTLAVALGLVFPAPQAMAQTKQVLRISTAAVPEDWITKSWLFFKDTLEKSAPGEFDIQVHMNGSLFKQGTESTAMARGNLEMAGVSAQDITKIVPDFNIFTAGYIIRDPDHQQKVFNGPIGEDVFKPVAQKMEITPLATAYLGTRQLMLREDRTVMTPADLKDLKLRMPASKEWLFLGSALGATPTPMAYGEVYLALKTGTIDGQENPLATDRAAKFYEVSKTIVLTSHLVDCLFMSVSSKFYNALTPVQQQKVKAAAMAAAKYNNENNIKDEVALLDFFKAQGLKVLTPNVAEFRKAVQAKYLSSEAAASWPKGLLQRINDVK